jgi:hypothetical protein
MQKDNGYPNQKITKYDEVKLYENFVLRAHEYFLL